MDALRLSFGLLTVLPAGRVHADRDVAGAAMTAAPAIGLVLGALAALVGAVGGLAGLDNLTASVLAVATLVFLTGGLHLDGLADTADGLGSGPARNRALAVMRTSDIGPFGVVAVVLALLAEVAALAEVGSPPSWKVAAAVAVAAATGRLAACCACMRGFWAARPEGLGALVIGTVRPLAALGACLAVLAVAAVSGAASGLGALRAAAAVLVGLACAFLLLVRAQRRLGGSTGDVLGALVEVATAAALVVCAT